MKHFFNQEITEEYVNLLFVFRIFTAPCSSLYLKVNNSKGERHPHYFLQNLKFLDSVHSVSSFHKQPTFRNVIFCSNGLHIGYVPFIFPHYAVPLSNKCPTIGAKKKEAVSAVVLLKAFIQEKMVVIPNLCFP